MAEMKVEIEGRNGAKVVMTLPLSDDQVDALASGPECGPPSERQQRFLRTCVEPMMLAAFRGLRQAIGTDAGSGGG